MKIYRYLLLLLLLCSTSTFAITKGIYLTQYTLENTAFLTYLLQNAKAAGINTFVVDMEKPTKRYRENIALLKDYNMQYVARIVMFPGGGTPEMINNVPQWQRKLALVKQAIEWGASEIQLDYIRFNTQQRASDQNAVQIANIIGWFKEKLSGQNIGLQADIFGIASFGDERHIGQSVKLFAKKCDALCPMVYPSHFEPYAEHYKTPYKTIYKALTSINAQFNNKVPIKIIPWIELSNYHYTMSHDQKVTYIKEQLRAVHDANADGFFAWSARNRYENLFIVLKHE